MHLPFRLSPAGLNERLPISLYCVGVHIQHPVARPAGFPVMQCFIGFGGKGRFDFPDGRSVYIEEGQALLLDANEAHQYEPLPRHPWQLGFIGFDGSSSRSILDALDLPLGETFSLLESASLAAGIESLWQLADRGGASDARLLSTRLYEYLLMLSSLSAGETKDSSTQVPTRHSDSALELAIHYLHDHFAEPLVMSNVARAVGYSVQHFQRLFREAYGEPPLAYLRRIRLHEAAVWLEKHPNTSVSEAASRVGMEPNYFIRSFKQAYGVPPGHYRRGKKE